MPIRVQLKLDIKYWGDKTLHRIVAQIVDLIKKDEAKGNSYKLHYVRIHVKVRIKQDFPNHIHFINEYEERTEEPVLYEWKPNKCSVSKIMGHGTKECRKRVKLVWVAKSNANVIGHYYKYRQSDHP